MRDLKGHQAVVLPMVGEFGGRIIDTAGDGILAEWRRRLRRYVRIYDEGINVAAPPEGIAEPGGICVSGKVHEEISGRFDLSFPGHGRAAAQEGWRHERQPIFLSSLAACGVAQRARSAEKHALGLTSNLLPLVVTLRPFQTFDLGWLTGSADIRANNICSSPIAGPAFISPTDAGAVVVTIVENVYQFNGCKPCSIAFGVLRENSSRSFIPCA